MNYFIKINGTLIILCWALSSFTQCIAGFEFDDSSLVVSFTDQSEIVASDSIINYQWSFGDNATSALSSPIHIYNESGAHDVTLVIESVSGCTDSITQSIYICDFNLEYNIQLGCDEDNKVKLDLYIEDTYGSAEDINVTIDGELINDTPLMTINDTVSISIDLLADGQDRLIEIQSELHPNCSLSEIVQVNSCVPPCNLFGFDIVITNNGAINALVTEDGYSPEVLNISTGDTVIFNWLIDDKSVTSNPNNNGQNWDSGLLSMGEEYSLYSFAPGIFSYQSSNDANNNNQATLVSTCPDSAYYDLQLTFRNQEQSGSYDLWVDGVPIIFSQPYSSDGFDTLQITMPGDGILHEYMIRDATSSSCNLSSNIQAPICGVTSDCNMFVSASQIAPCDQDSTVALDITVLSAGGSLEGFDLYIDDELIESSIPYVGTQTVITRSLFGDGNEHSIKVIDGSIDSCLASTTILLEDCTQSCMIINGFAGVGSNKNFISNVLNDTFLPKDITISSGDKIIWQWQTDTLRSVTAYDFLFDSGVKGPGESFTTPILPVGVHRYYSEFNGMEGSITVEPNCENGLIPIVYNFNKFGGANTGYNVFVDSVKINGTPIPYAANGNNSGNSFVLGNGESHTVEMIDAVDSTCMSIQSFTVPFCDESTCALYLENVITTTCNDNNTIDVTVDLVSYNNIDSTFILFLDDIIQDTIVFDTSGVTPLNVSLPGNGNTYMISVQDLGEEFCADTLSFTTPQCQNPCSFKGINIDYLVESDLDSCFDGTVQLMITTDAIHLFDSDYTLTLSSESIAINESYNYPINGMINHVYTLPANGETLEVKIFNSEDINCTTDTSFQLYTCDLDPCVISLQDLTYSTCRDGGAIDITIDIDTFRVSDSLNILLDSIDIFKGSYSDFYNDPTFEIIYNGQERTLTLIDVLKAECISESKFFTPVCNIDCTIETSYELIDSCILAESSHYDIIVTGSVLNAASDSILIDLVSSSISSQHSYEELRNGISLSISREDNNPTLGIFDLSDTDCRSFIAIDPPTCILDCGIDISNIDLSNDSCINGFRSVEFALSYQYQDSDSIAIILDDILIATEEYPTDSLISISIVGDGLTHNIKVYDLSNQSCSDTVDLISTLCEFTCSDFNVDFNIAIDTLTKTVNFTDISSGNPDNWSWDLGDGIVSSDTNPFHTYSNFGTYTICLTAQNLTEGCTQSICKDIELLDINCNAEYSHESEDLQLSFQSISTASENINSLIWTIDEDTILVNELSGSYTAVQSETIELCLNIQTVTNCNSVYCESISLMDPCTILPSFDTSINFDTIQLTNTSMGMYNSTSWSFGDGISFSGSDVQYTYPQDGEYEVCMTVSNTDIDNCEFTSCETVSIYSCDLSAIFLVNINQDTLNATLVSPQANQTLSWDFGNGFSADLDTIQFVYTEEGNYTVCATVVDTNVDLCQETHCEEITIVITDIVSNDLNEISVYPNPIRVGEKVRIINKERKTLSIDVYSHTGQKLNVELKNEGDTYFLSTHSLMPGKYLLHISSKDEYIVKSIILID